MMMSGAEALFNDEGDEDDDDEDEVDVTPLRDCSFTGNDKVMKKHRDLCLNPNKI